MLDFEDQVQQHLPIPLPRVKFGSLEESGDEVDNDETDDDVSTATPKSSGLVDDDPEVPSSLTQSLADQIHALTAHFDAYWDESQKHWLL